MNIDIKYWMMDSKRDKAKTRFSSFYDTLAYQLPAKLRRNGVDSIYHINSDNYYCLVLTSLVY